MLHLYLLCRPDRTQTVAARITDQIRSRYRDAEIVWDVPFADATVFARHVETTMQRCNAMLVVIGPNWLQTRSPHGLPWQDDPADPVVLGLLAALRQKKLIVPLLVHGATMPSAGDLAPRLAAFVLHQGIVLREDPFFHTDLRKMYTQINTQLTWRPASTPLLLTAIGTFLTFAVSLVFALAYHNHISKDFLSYRGPLFVIFILTILLNLALCFSALIGAFVLTIQRKQVGWLVGLIMLTLAGIALIVIQGNMLAWELPAILVITIFSLLGKRREMM